MRNCKRIPPRPPAAVESMRMRSWTPQTLYDVKPWAFIVLGAILGVGTMLWSLSAGQWTLWRGLLCLGGVGPRDRGRRHFADASGVSRQQQVAARRPALIRTAVIGVGYLGRFHAQKYASLPNSQLVGIADPSADGARGAGRGTSSRGARRITAIYWAKSMR